MSIPELLIRVSHVTQAATPSPSPTSGPDAKLDVVASNFVIAGFLLGGSILVIAVALGFAFSYHTKLLEVVKFAVKYNGARIGTESSNVAALRSLLQSVDSGSDIVGPETGAPSKKLQFSLNSTDIVPPISWTTKDGDPQTFEGATFATRFDSVGTHEVTATYTDSTNVSHPFSKNVTITAPAPTPAPSIVLPFVIKNWGRLVIVIFGVGVISALMSTKILDAAAGIGILGTLLGVGAVTATSGTTGGEPAAPKDDHNATD